MWCVWFVCLVLFIIVDCCTVFILRSVVFDNSSCLSFLGIALKFRRFSSVEGLPFLIPSYISRNKMGLTSSPWKKGFTLMDHFDRAIEHKKPNLRTRITSATPSVWFALLSCTKQNLSFFLNEPQALSGRTLFFNVQLLQKTFLFLENSFSNIWKRQEVPLRDLFFLRY